MSVHSLYKQNSTASDAIRREAVEFCYMIIVDMQGVHGTKPTPPQSQDEA